MPVDICPWTYARGHGASLGQGLLQLAPAPGACRVRHVRAGAIQARSISVYMRTYNDIPNLCPCMHQIYNSSTAAAAYCPLPSPTHVRTHTHTRTHTHAHARTHIALSRPSAPLQLRCAGRRGQRHERPAAHDSEHLLAQHRGRRRCCGGERGLPGADSLRLRGQQCMGLRRGCGRA